MAAIRWLEQLEQAVFILLGVAALAQWARRRSAGSAWLALTLGTLGAIVALSKLVATPAAAHRHPDVVRAVVVLFTCFPFALYQFGRRFVPLRGRRRALDRIALASLAALLLVPATLDRFPAAGDPRPRWYGGYVLGFVGYWSAASIWTSVSLFRAGRDQPDVIRRRLQTLGAATAVLDVALVLSVGAGARPHDGPRIVLQLVASSAAALFVLGFSPPRSLRLRWRRRDLEVLRRAEAELIDVETEAAVVSIVLPAAQRLLGATAAFLVDGDGNVRDAHPDGAELPADAGARLRSGRPRAPFVAGDLVAVPVRRGWLALLASANAPLLTWDEVASLESLGNLAGLGLERATLYQQDRRARADLAQRERELADAQRSARLGSYSWDLRTGAITWSAGMRCLLGYAPEEPLDFGPAFLARIHPADRELVTRGWARVRSDRSRSSYEYRIVRPDGEVRWLHGQVEPVLGDDGGVRRLVGTVQDVTERRAADERMIHQARHDALTGLPNRLALLDRLTGLLERRREQPSGFAVLFVDVDRFKWLNDSRGHAAGDALLVALAGRLTAVLREGDTVARFGGDEFVMLCTGVEDEATALLVGERVAAALTAPAVVAGEETTLTVSVGIAHVPADVLDITADAVVRDADTAMYQAKDAGRDRCAVFHPTSRATVVARHETVNALRRGIERGEFVVHFQPEVDLATGRLVGFEALARWNRDGRILGPADFIPLAEETGLIVPIGLLVLRAACRQVAAWAARPDGRDLTVAVNLAARQLVAPDLAEEVEGALAESGLDPRRLCLEITESALVEDADACARALQRLKALGVSIGVDDFGTGFSSLTYLRRFPVDVLKIDRSFVHGLGRHREDRAIVASIVDLAHAFGLTTVAEGVETIDQREQLRELGCASAQGFLWSPPLPADEAERWVAATGTVALPPATVDPAVQRVLVVDDDAGFRSVLRSLIESEPGYAVVAEAEDGRAAISAARHHAPDLVLLDLAMPGMGGLDALPLIQAVAPRARIVALSALDGSDAGGRALREGAAGFVSKADDLAGFADRLFGVVPLSRPA